VDRLTFGGNIIETGTESYRLAHTRAKRAAERDWGILPHAYQHADRGPAAILGPRFRRIPDLER
jgi:hypothetical protein